MKIKSIREIGPIASRCIEVAAEDRVFLIGDDGETGLVTHNSVVQRNIVFSCILRPDSWRFLGVDLKKVELSGFRQYSNVVLGIATELEQALLVLRFGQQTMMKRYSEMEQIGVNNFLDLPEKGKALLIMVDEAGELLGSSGVKALSVNTPIPTPLGMRRMGDLQMGDEVLDLHSAPTVVTKKYEPAAQEKYALTISKDSTGESENFVAGAEHYWVAYFKHPEGEVTGPSVVDTKYIRDFHKNQLKLAEDDRVTIKFKKYIPV